ncbi:transcriptional regulator, partial [Butyricicoccus sp. 1XD8-22]
MKRTTTKAQQGASLSRIELRAQVIEAIAKTMDLYGANHSFGKLYGIMFFEER